MPVCVSHTVQMTVCVIHWVYANRLVSKESWTESLISVTARTYRSRNLDITKYPKTSHLREEDPSEDPTVILTYMSLDAELLKWWPHKTWGQAESDSIPQSKTHSKSHSVFPALYSSSHAICIPLAHIAERKLLYVPELPLLIAESHLIAEHSKDLTHLLKKSNYP